MLDKATRPPADVTNLAQQTQKWLDTQPDAAIKQLASNIPAVPQVPSMPNVPAMPQLPALPTF